MRPLEDLESMADTLFSENEKQVWDRLSGSAKQETFFDCWTKKEAVLKARGSGLSDDLKNVIVLEARDLPVKCDDVDCLFGFSPRPGYRASLATLREPRPAWLQPVETSSSTHTIDTRNSLQ
jgi:phosphopantetheinyl transferase